VIEPGTPAPAFQLDDHSGNATTLSDFEGRRLLICFYPKDFSPVCSDQLAAYVPVAGEIAAAGADLVGVSVDHSWAHRAFRMHLGIPFRLLADFHPKGEMASAYGAYLPEPDGVVSWVQEDQNPTTFAAPERILEALGA
jgi:peroxiredoxin